MLDTREGFPGWKARMMLTAMKCTAVLVPGAPTGSAAVVLSSLRPTRPLGRGARLVQYLVGLVKRCVALLNPICIACAPSACPQGLQEERKLGQAHLA